MRPVSTLTPRAARPAPVAPRLVARRGRRLVFLEVQEIWALEAESRLTYVHSVYGKFDVDFSLAAVLTAVGYPLVRVHRKWLANFAHVKELEVAEGALLFVGSRPGEEGHGVRVPVSRDLLGAVRHALLAGTIGAPEPAAVSLGVESAGSTDSVDADDCAERGAPFAALQYTT